MNTTAYHPQTNGLTERFNATLCQMLSSYCNESQTDWDVFLPIVLFAYRVSMQQTTGESPFRLLYGRDPRIPSDIENFTARSDFIDNVQEAWKEAQKNIERSANTSKDRSNKATRKATFNVGDLVRVEMPANKVGQKMKLRRDLYQGPNKITAVSGKGNAEIETEKRRVWVHFNRLKLAETERA